MATWNELIDGAFTDIGTVQPGESITTAMRTHAQGLLNQLLSSLSTEGATVYTHKTYSTILQAGTVAYTVGSGGSLNAGERVQRLTWWRAYYAGVLHSGGPVLSLDQFGAVAKQADGAVKPIPDAVGADTAYPLLNMRLFPPPSVSGGTLEVGGWVPLAAISDFTVTPTLPAGWELMIRLQLALLLYPTYARQGGIPQELAANAMNAKAAIVNQNTAGKPAEAQ
jgi:hypothetical protein